MRRIWECGFLGFCIALIADEPSIGIKLNVTA